MRWSRGERTRLSLSKLALALLAAPTRGEGSKSLVANGGFEDGLHGWDVHCALERCAEVTTERLSEGDRTAAHGSTSSGLNVASLRSSADEWNAVALRQELFGASGPLEGPVCF